jgi:putative protease
MNILAPFSRPSEVPPLIEAGASELYCGVVDRRWQSSYSFVSSVNLRHDKAASLSSFKQLGAAVEAARGLKASVFLVLNAHFYSPKQLPLVLKQAEKAVNAGVESLIVADAALIPELKREFDVRVSLSTANPVFNSHALDFFKGLGVDRVVFPRHLTVKELGQLSAHAKKIGLAAECFALNTICPYIDGLCSFQHIVDKSISFLPMGNLACRLPFKVKAVKGREMEKVLAAESHARLWNNALSRDCGLCALPFFKRFGIDSIKIAGRAHSLEKKLADVQALKRALVLLKGKLSVMEFREKCREFYFGLFHNACGCINCYYAGVGFGED